VGYN